MHATLILASSSIYRQELLSRLQLPFVCISPEIDETPLAHEQPEQTALRLAQLKAKKIALQQPDALIIGCDQVATLDGMQLGKPMNHFNATKQLQLMRGREVTFHSALCLYNAKTQAMQASVVPYCVQFRDLSDAEIFVFGAALIFGFSAAFSFKTLADFVFTGFFSFLVSSLVFFIFT